MTSRFTPLCALLLLFSSCNQPAEDRTVLDASAGMSMDVAGDAREDDEDDDAEELEERVALSEVPQELKDAALAAVPGLVLEEAEKEGRGVYCLHGTAGGEFVEVEVDSEGKILEIERGADDDDD